MRDVITILMAILFIAIAIRAARTDELPMRNGTLKKSEYPLIFYTMIGVYLLIAMIVLICVSGYLPKLIEMTN